MSLIIKVNDLIQAPDDNNPVLTDLSAGIFFDFDARNLSLSDGDIVNNWIASGPAPIDNRSLNYVKSGDFEAPTFSQTGGPNGGPTVVYNKKSNLRTALDQPSLYVGDLTIAIVAKAVTPPSNYARFYSDPLTLPDGSATQIAPSVSGNLWISTDLDSQSKSEVNPETDVVIVLSRSSESDTSMFSFEDDVTVVEGEGHPAHRGLVTGVSRASAATGGFDGSITRIIMYSRALPATEVRALVGSLKTEYNI